MDKKDANYFEIERLVYMNAQRDGVNYEDLTDDEYQQYKKIAINSYLESIIA